MYFTFDRTDEFCQAAHMIRSIKKFIAVSIAIWLPLFSGNVLAVSVAMQAMGSDCHPAAVQQDEHQLHHAAAAQHYQDAVDQDQSFCMHDQQDSACGNTGICHLACSGYLAAASIKLVDVRPFAQSFTLSSTQFQSVAITPLDPPPLART